MGHAKPAVRDEPPAGDLVTAYDREHVALYLRLLDSARDSTDWREAVRLLFSLDPDANPERARQIYDSHLARAQWLSRRGYRKLASEGS